MKTTLDIPESLLTDVRKYSDSPTKRAAVITALEEYVRRKKMAGLVQLRGSMTTVMSQADLKRAREANR